MKKQKTEAKINLEALAGGAFAEKLNEALIQVADNIQNPNTEATTKRQIRRGTGHAAGGYGAIQEQGDRIHTEARHMDMVRRRAHGNKYM